MGFPVLQLLVALVPAVVAPPSADFVGQVVCSQCWFEADRSKVPYGTPSDLACASRCAKEKVPVALAVKEGSEVELLLLEGREDWSGMVGGFVRVQGAIEERAGKRVLRVASTEKMTESPWGAPRANEGEPGTLSWVDLG